ncbi:MAG TPA: hypothetical protein ENJ10_07710 [Caldithrix abyssi]|uniref:Uncharacterized protein n=1 Tax=Caldithrix abyssi TaxID=187145 RepID=A0A7V1PUK2_CALAY|nr:hypothetical protein [Caldithrix abyssi]
MKASQALERAKRVKRAHEHEWLALSNVVSIGIGNVHGVTGIIIGVKNHPDAVREKIAAEIEGIPIEIKTLRELKAL